MTFGERLRDMAHNIGYSMGLQSQKYSNTFLNKQKDRKALEDNIELSVKSSMNISQRLQDTRHNIKYKAEKVQVAVSEKRESLEYKIADLKYNFKIFIHKLNPFKAKDADVPRYSVPDYEAITSKIDKESPVLKDIKQKQQDIREGVVRPTADTIAIDSSLGEQGVEMKSIQNMRNTLVENDKGVGYGSNAKQSGQQQGR